METIENSICNAINILLNKKINDLQYNKTIFAKVIKQNENNTNEYIIEYQNYQFTAINISNQIYDKDDIVYVLIPNSDFNNSKFILGISSSTFFN